MTAREVVDVLTDDDAEVLEAHPVDALVNGRDELDERDRSAVEDIERLGEHDQGDRTPVPDVLAVRPRMALEKRALVNVKVPIGDADGEVAERVGCDVDAAGNKAVALHRREGSIVPDDLGDRIRRRHVPAPPPPCYARPNTRSPVGNCGGSTMLVAMVLSQGCLSPRGDAGIRLARRAR